MDNKAHRNWSITENFEGIDTPPNYVCAVPGWKLTGQWERGENGILHFQGQLKTPPTKFAAIKREFPRAHIEVTRCEAALAAYVNKDETRVAEYSQSSVPNMFEFQRSISARWKWEDFNEFIKEANDPKTLLTSKDIKQPDELALLYLDNLVSTMIEEGAIGLEFISINPMWRSSWKRFWRSILKRNQKKTETNDIIECPVAPQDLPQNPE